MMFSTRLRGLHRAAATALALVVMCTLAACGGGSGDGDKSMTVSVPQLGDLLHTTRAVGPILGVLLQGLEPLVVYEPGGDVTPNLATSYEQVTPTRYRFDLRKGVEFWDDSPLTSEDVVASFEVHMGKDSKSASASYWTGVSSVNAAGEHSVVVDLDAPDPSFVYTVARTGIFSADYAKRNGDDLGSPSVLNMGTGPYRFESFEPFSSVELVRNEDYWGRKPKIPRIDAQVLEKDTLLPGLKSGEIDAAFALPASQLESFKDLESFTVTDVPDAAVYKFNFDVTKQPWDDPHVRRAFAHTIDRGTIADEVLDGAEPATALVPDVMFGDALDSETLSSLYDDVATHTPEFDLDKARQELAQSSQPDGFETTVLVMASDPNLSAIAQTVAQSAAEVGIDLKIREVDESTYNNAVYLKHTTDGLSIDNFGAGSPDYLNIADLSLNGKNVPPAGFTNVANYQNSNVDRILHDASQLEADDPKRAKLALKVLRVSGPDQPYAPVVYPKVYLGLRDGYTYAGFNAFWWMNRWPRLIADQES